MSATDTQDRSTPAWQEILGWTLLLAITVAAAWLRFDELALKPLHHDEGVNAWFTKRLVEEFHYRYNPYYYHGPFLYFITAPFIAIFGYTPEAMRIAPALLGTLVVPAFALFKARVGWLGVLTMAAFMAVAPVEVYFSRTAIHEIYNGVFNVTLIGGLYVYWRDRAPWGLYLAAASLALLFATKETTAITVLAILPAALVTAALAKPRTGLPGALSLPHRVIALGPSWWRLPRNGSPSDEAPWPGPRAPRSVQLAAQRLADALALSRATSLEAMTAQREAQAVSRTQHAPQPPKAPASVRFMAQGRIAASRIPFLSFSFEYVRALRRADPRTVRIAIVVFVAVMFLLFTSFFTDLNGVWKFFAAFFGWGNTGVQGKGHEKVWYYFIEKLLWAYYQPILLIGLPALVIGSIRRDAFSLFNLVWFVLALSAYSVIPYKTPWCSISFATPLFFGMGIAVKGIVDLAQRIPLAPLRPLAAGIPLLAGLYPLGILAQESYQIQFKDYDVDGLHFVYVQNIREYLDLVEDLNGLIDAAALEGAKPPMIFAIRAKNPLRWYIPYHEEADWTREYKKDREKDMKAADIVIAQRSQSKDLKTLLDLKQYEYRWYHERPGQKFDVYIKKPVWERYLKAAKAGKVPPPTEEAKDRSYSDDVTAEWRRAKRAADREAVQGEVKAFKVPESAPKMPPKAGRPAPVKGEKASRLEELRRKRAQQRANRPAPEKIPADKIPAEDDARDDLLPDEGEE